MLLSHPKARRRLEGWMLPKSAVHVPGRSPGTAHWGLLKVQPLAVISNGQFSARNTRNLQRHLFMNHKDLQIPPFRLGFPSPFVCPNIVFSAPCFPFMAHDDSVLGFVTSFPPLQKQSDFFCFRFIFSHYSPVIKAEAANILKDIYLDLGAHLWPHIAWNKPGVNCLKSKRYRMCVKAAPFSPAGDVAINCPGFSLNLTEKELSPSHAWKPIWICKIWQNRWKCHLQSTS